MKGRIVPDSELEHLEDEEYLVFRAKEEQSQNPHAAKCWLITAQIIFPKNFGIQFEIYKIAKQDKNVKEAATCLGSLFQNFQSETALWLEIDAIMAILCEPSTQNPSHMPFLSQIFFKLSKDTQKSIVLSAAERSKDTMTYVSLMLLLMSSFPENTAYNGLTLVDALLKAEKPVNNNLNPYRRKLVCEVLPCLLKANGLEVRPKILYTLLTKSIEFYVAYSTTPLKAAQAKLDTDTVIEDPWQELFSIVRMIGWNLGWELAAEFDTVSNRELILQRIQNMVEGGARLGGPKGDNCEDVREVLFVTVAVFLHALLDYTRRLGSDFIHGENANASPPPLTLVEAFIKPEKKSVTSPGNQSACSSKVLFSPPTPKRLRPSIEEEQTPALITVSSFSQISPQSSLSSSDNLVGVGSSTPLPFGSILQQTNVLSGALSQALITAIKCWDLLHAYDTLSSECARILEGLGIEKWLVIFNMDVLIYEGRLSEAEGQLQHALAMARQSNQTNSSLTILTLNLKLASVLFALSKFSAATESALEVVEQLAPLSNHGGLTPNLVVSTSPLRRHLHLLALTQSQCLQFITTMLIYSLRHLIMVEGNTDDLCLGHLIVLLQCEWPRHSHIFDEVLDAIRKKGGFAYQFFAPYVTTMNMLEKFMILANKSEAGFQLDILPLPHTSKQQRMSTRGADRDSKQDFKTAMRRQLQRCNESVETNMISFLTRQGPYIPHVFM